jgi:hypothetical protein
LSEDRLRAVRHALLELHKVLLEAERVRYERVQGGIRGPGEFLQLVLHDSWFAWLRPLSALVVQIDELFDAKEPATAAAIEALLEQGRTLLKPTEEGEEFGRQYHEALQAVPDVVLAHREVMRLLKP